MKFVKESEINIMNTLMIVLLPSIFNVLIVKYKRKKTLDKMCNDFEEQGYMVDSRLKRNIPYKIVEKMRKYQDSNYYKDLAIYSWFPVVNWFSIVSNIKYLLGDYTGINECYATLEDLSKDESIIDFLEKEDLIKADLEKQKWLTDKENAMKELEELEQKYENDTVETKETIEKYSSDELCNELKRRGLKIVEVSPKEAINIFLKIEEEGILDKNNTIDEVYEKMRQLLEIVERKKANGEEIKTDEIKLTLGNQ